MRSIKCEAVADAYIKRFAKNAVCYNHNLNLSITKTANIKSITACFGTITERQRLQSDLGDNMQSSFRIQNFDRNLGGVPHVGNMPFYSHLGCGRQTIDDRNVEYAQGPNNQHIDRE